VPRHPIIQALMADIDAGRQSAPTIRSPQSGAADVLISVAAPLSKQGGADYALVFYQLALYLDSQNAYGLLGLADLYSDLKQSEKSVATYERVPMNAPLRRNAEIELGGALDALDRTDEAVAHLKKIIAKNPKDLDAIISLGGVFQGRKRFAEAAVTFTQALDVIGEPKKANWSTFYYRGIAFERTKQWPKAELDFKKALELYPDQPSVLNYLGYSWIDQGVHLEDGMAMIKKAVEQRPDDGYIVDSLGWAHFKIGQYDQAVTQLERAVALKASDPTINDHLGDAYWRVGRKLEATFQWHHARDSKPEPARPCTGSAPRSDAAAEKTWVSFICSCRSSLFPAIHWRCCRLRIFMNHSRSRSWRSRSTSACRQIRRCTGMRQFKWPLISIA